MEKARFLLVSLLLGQLYHISAQFIIIDTYIDGFRRMSDNRPTNVRQLSDKRRTATTHRK